MGGVMFNNNEHELPQRKTCVKCEEDMKLELLEDTRRQVTYTYVCMWYKCKHVEIVSHEDN